MVIGKYSFFCLLCHFSSRVVEAMEGFCIFSWDLLGSGADGLVFYSRIACLTHVTVTIYIIIDDGDDDDANNNNIFSDTSFSKHRHSCILWSKSLLNLIGILSIIIDVRTF